MNENNKKKTILFTSIQTFPSKNMNRKKSKGLITTYFLGGGGGGGYEIIYLRKLSYFSRKKYLSETNKSFTLKKKNLYLAVSEIFLIQTERQKS